MTVATRMGTNLNQLFSNFRVATQPSASDDNGNNANDNIIRTPDCAYEPEGGLGNEYFRFMKLHKNKVAQYIVDTQGEDTYGALLKRCVRTALKLKAEAITSDDIVCLCSYNHINSCVPFIAATFLGIKVASLDPSLSKDDTIHLLKQVKPSFIFVVPEALDLITQSVKEGEITSKLVIFGESNEHTEFSDYLKPHEDEKHFVPVHISSQETAVIFFSSGTTGLPKGICQNSYALICQAVNTMDTGVITSVNLYYSSLYWISAAVFQTAAVMSGMARVICRKFDPAQVWNLIEKYEVSFLFLAPNQALEMVKVGRPEDLNTTSLLALVTGGGTFSERQLIYLRDVLPGTFVTQGYGQTEVAGAISFFKMNDPKHALYLHYKPASCGQAAQGICCKVVNPETEETLGPHQEGELRVKTKFVMNGYHNLDASDSFDNNGWLKTGDIVYYDDDKCLFVVDRIKEMLKYKSWHVAPAMLERLLSNHPAIKKTVVIGLPHEEDGDHPMALVILEPGRKVTEEEIEKFVEERVMDRQRLRAGVKFVEKFPMTPSGKIKRQELKKMVMAGQI